MRYYTFWFLMLFGLILFGQKSEFERYKELCRTYQQYPDSLLKYGQRLLELPEAEAQYEGSFTLGLANYRSNEMKRALTYYQRALQLAKVEKAFPKEVQARKNLALVWKQLGEIDQALAHMDSLEESAEQKGDTLALALVYNNRGSMYRQLGDYARAAIEYQQAYAFADKNRHDLLANLATNMGILYGQKGSFQKSDFWFRESLREAEWASRIDLKAKALGNLGYSKYQSEDFDSSMFYYVKALAIYRQSMASEPLSITYRNMALSLLAQDQIGRAKTYVDSSYRYASKDNLSFKSRLYLLQTDLLLQMGDTTRALKYCDSLISAYRVLKEPEGLANALRKKSLLVEKLGSTTHALSLERQASVLTDSLNRYQDMEVIHASGSEIALAQRAMEVDEIKRESLRFKQFTWLLFTAFGVSIIGLYFWFQQNGKKRLEFAKSSINGSSSQIEPDEEQIKNTIVLKSKAYITLSQLIYIETDGHYLNFHTIEGREIDRNSLRQVLTELPSEQFLQIHRSFVVNLTYVRALYSDRVLLKNGMELPVSRTYKSALDKLKAR